MRKLDGEFRFALEKSMPVLFGYVTLGLGYGLYMHNLGFSFWYPTLMALTIYGGSVEFVIANMLVQHFTPLNVLLITLVVGFRQSFYALSMLKQYRHTGWRKVLLIFGLTDETFVINHYTKVPQEMSQVKVNTWITILDWGYWVLGAFLGGFLGSALQLQVKGLDFVMTALFIVLALDQFLQEKSHVSSISGILITIISLLAVGKTYFLVVTLLLLVAEYYYLTKRRAKGDD
ncbi:AzlC family ABC transporter permease [Limosilactobacillus urinaemulieris]|uniref:AzlC family ABC transporter permease n=1 Tax=Limosilactobacillus urinaemulieris TaxID=2742600 RepID=UPI0028EDB185|nr:AzlC family ABC transporter permease [Limosilactobacillus urinaemulieris]